MRQRGHNSDNIWLAALTVAGLCFLIFLMTPVGIMFGNWLKLVL